MRNSFLLWGAIILFSVGFYSCGSSGYDLEEADIPPDTNQVEITKAEIKEELEKPTPEVKEDLSKVKTPVVENYTVQIGAFKIESNAWEVIEKARALFTPEVYYKLADGLFKVRLGKFTSVSEALELLNKVKDSGFPDSFIIEADR